MHDRRHNLHLDQFAGAWAMKADRFREMSSSFRRFSLNEHIEAQTQFVAETEDATPAPYEMAADGIAQINIRGVMTKYGSSLTGGGSVQARRAVTLAANDPKVRGILLVIDSPGGTVAGTGDLADAIHAVNKSKPICAFVEDLAASAAYWTASQAGRIVASPNSEIGSIGTYARVEDWSKAYEQAGCKVHVIKAGDFKGAGEPGTEITDAQLAEWQGEINSINELFVAAVSRGRAAYDTTGWADGRVRRADRALKAGMIDALGTLDTALQELTTMINDKTKAEDMPMDDEEKKDEETTDPNEPTEPADEEKKDEEDAADAEATATIAQLRTLGSAEFALACAEAGLTLAQARVLADAEKARAAEVATLRAKVARLEAGQEPVDSAPPSAEQVASVDQLEKQMKAEWAKRHVSGTPAYGGFSSYESFAALRIRELTGKEHSK